MAFRPHGSSALPLIIVTGLLDTEPVAECVAAGAADYVFQQDVSRLAPGVLSALQRARLRLGHQPLEKQRHRAELDLARQYALLRTVLDNSDAAICALDLERRYTVLARAYALLVKENRVAQAVGRGLSPTILSSGGWARCYRKSGSPRLGGSRTYR